MYYLILVHEETIKMGQWILYSWFRASWLYIRYNEMHSMQVFIYCKITLHVSVVYRTHHQEYIKL